MAIIIPTMTIMSANIPIISIAYFMLIIGLCIYYLYDNWLVYIFKIRKKEITDAKLIIENQNSKINYE